MKLRHPSEKSILALIICLVVVAAIIYLFYAMNSGSSPEDNWYQQYYQQNSNSNSYSSRENNYSPPPRPNEDPNTLFNRIQPIWRRMDAATRARATVEWDRFVRLLELDGSDTWETMTTKFRKCQKIIHPDKNSKDAEDSVFVNSFHQFLRKAL